MNQLWFGISTENVVSIGGGDGSVVSFAKGFKIRSKVL